MALHHAVLALLVDGPRHGYGLKARFEETMGPQWGGLNIGHVYQVLGRLVRDGYAVANAEQQAHRPDRVVYALTTPGARNSTGGCWSRRVLPRATGTISS